METLASTDIGNDISAIIARVAESKDPLVLTNGGSQSVVVLSLAEFQSMQETLYLLSSPVNVAHLQKSIADLEQGRGVPVGLDERYFGLRLT